MKSLQDALYNWLTIKVVRDARPFDNAAEETEQLFYAILTKEFQISELDVYDEGELYNVSFKRDNEIKQQRFPKELVEVMLTQIELAPDKYRNFDE